MTSTSVKATRPASMNHDDPETGLQVSVAIVDIRLH